MFKEITGNAWDYYEAGAHICITTNGTINNGGQIVCGAGIAEQARVRWGLFPRALAQLHEAYGQHVFLMQNRMISFPVKFNWWEMANSSLIHQSYEELLSLISLYKINRVILPRPGCGNGKLKWEDVRNVLESVSKRIDSTLSEKISIISDGKIEKAIAAGAPHA